MPHDGIHCEGYPIAWHRSGAHPWWMYFLLPACQCQNHQGIEDTHFKDWEDQILDSGINVSCKILGGSEFMHCLIKLISYLFVLHFIFE